jgi:8-oxo-dGTP pyrophosphatase MutT (NUDIX family)
LNIGFLDPVDNVYGEYCLHCHVAAVEWIVVDGRKSCVCRSCGRRAERAVVIDPDISWWLDEDGEYWHESAGVFVRDPSGKFLFFDRTAYPYAMTVPAGHVSNGESPQAAAARELGEEVGIRGGELRHVTSEPLRGDVCRRGSDAHLWHAYLLPITAEADVTVNEEGTAPVWLTLSQARSRRLTYAVRRIIEEFAGDLD